MFEFPTHNADLPCCVNTTPCLASLLQYCDNLEAVCIETIESGFMTKDLAICIKGEYIRAIERGLILFPHYAVSQSVLYCLQVLPYVTPLFMIRYQEAHQISPVEIT